MFCRKCGAETADDAVFCAKCGERLNTVLPEETETDPKENVTDLPDEEAVSVPAPVAGEEEKPIPVQTPMPVKNTEKGPSALPIFILGIVAAVLAIEVGPAGIVCGIICRKKVKQYLNEGGELTGKAKIGNILGLVGLFVGIGSSVMLVCSVLWSIVLIFIRGVEYIGNLGQQLNGGISVFDKLIDLINRMMDVGEQFQGTTPGM